MWYILFNFFTKTFNFFTKKLLIVPHRYECIYLVFSVKIARNPAEFFAERINGAIAGAGTDDTDLIRCVVSRSEVRIVSCDKIPRAYHRKQYLVMVLYGNYIQVLTYYISYIKLCEIEKTVMISMLIRPNSVLIYWHVIKINKK